MKAEEHLRAARVEEALQSLQEDVRARPADPRLRAFLFQLLAVLGQWDRAATQLKVLADLDGNTLLLTRVYESLLQAEPGRRDILAGKADPVIFGEPEPWMATLQQGNKLAASGEWTAAQKCLQDALDAAPTTPMTINGATSQWLADADLRFGPMLEAMVDGRYFWVPFFRIKQLRIEQPRHLRDLIWLPAGFQWTNGGEAAGFIFARYPGTESARDGELLLSRKTEWQEKAEGVACGIGQRLLTNGDDDFPVLDMRTIESIPA